MSINKIQVQNGLLLLIILIAVSFRFVDMGENYAWANFTPVGAIALFAGTYFKDKLKSFIVPLAVLLLSDVLLMHKYTGSFNPYYSGIELVYLSFAVMVYLGSRIKKVNVLNVFLVSVLSVLVHWLLTDIHPWLSGPYTKDFSGYIAALVAAIPFEKNLLFGNLVFSLLMYGTYEVVKHKFIASKEVYA